MVTNSEFQSALVNFYFWDRVKEDDQVFVLSHFVADERPSHVTYDYGAHEETNFWNLVIACRFANFK